MLTSSQFRQNCLMMLTGGGAGDRAGMALSHRPEAAAVSASPKAEDLSAAFRQVASETIPSIVSIESMTKSKHVEIEGQQNPVWRRFTVPSVLSQRSSTGRDVHESRRNA